jgi:hypothetical protein
VVLIAATAAAAAAAVAEIAGVAVAAPVVSDIVCTPQFRHQEAGSGTEHYCAGSPQKVAPYKIRKLTWFWQTYRTSCCTVVAGESFSNKDCETSSIVLLALSGMPRADIGFLVHNMSSTLARNNMQRHLTRVRHVRRVLEACAWLCCSKETQGRLSWRLLPKNSKCTSTINGGSLVNPAASEATLGLFLDLLQHYCASAASFVARLCST